MRTASSGRRDLPAREESSNGIVEVIKAYAGPRNGNRFSSDSGLRKTVWLMGEPKVESLFPLFKRGEHRRRDDENIAPTEQANNGIWMETTPAVLDAGLKDQYAQT